MTAPIALFVYKRPDHLANTVEHLRLNEMADCTDLIVFSDAPANVADVEGVNRVRAYCHSIKGFQTIKLIERKENFGLRRSIIEGVSQIAQEYGRVIVMEDDVLTAPSFLRFMNRALEFYERFDTVACIGGFTPAPVTLQAKDDPNGTFFHYRVCSWGWATWLNRWCKADWEPQGWEQRLNDPEFMKLLVRGGTGMPRMFRASMEQNNQSWMARWYYNCTIHGMVSVYPVQSLTKTIGHDGSGVHFSRPNPHVCQKYVTSLPTNRDQQFNYLLPVAVNEKMHLAMKAFYDDFKGGLLFRAVRSIYRAVKLITNKVRNLVLHT